MSWVGISDQAWFEVEVPDPTEAPVDQKALVNGQIAQYLQDSLPMVAADNLSVTKEQRASWIEYRKKLNEISLQVGYPSEVYWPARPE